MKKLSVYKAYLRGVLDNQFPKGKSKERGAALVLFAHSVMMIKQAVKYNGERPPFLFDSELKRAAKKCKKVLEKERSNL